MPERSAQLGVKDGIVAGLTLEPARGGVRRRRARQGHLPAPGRGRRRRRGRPRAGDAARRHARAQGKAAVTLVERARTHLWKPLLHEVAAGSMDVDEHELDYLAQAHWHHFRYRFGEMIGLDRARKAVLLGADLRRGGPADHAARAPFRYDTLVIAIGSVTQRFRHARRRRSTRSRSTRRSRRARFNRRLVNACLRAHAQAEPVRPGQLHVAIIGAGATGTELAAELHRTARAVVAYGLDRIDPEKDIRITLIEAAPRILPALPERISEATTRLLRKLGVEVLHRPPGQRGAAPTACGSPTAASSRPSSWSGPPGVKGPDVLADLDGLEVSRSNQLVVAPDAADHARPRHLRHRRLRLLPAPTGTPGRCRRAPRPRTSRPRHMVGQIRRRLRGEPLEPFVYRDFGSLVSPRRVQHGRQPDGLPRRQEHVHRGLFRPADVPLALQDARAGAARHRARSPSSTLARAADAAGPSRTSSCTEVGSRDRAPGHRSGANGRLSRSAPSPRSARA